MRATTRKTALLGRDDELARVQNVLFNVRSEGSGAIVLLEGEAGIGKTRLLDELLTCAREQGFEVARGSAYELERDRPFGAVADALELVPDSADPERAAIGRLIGGGAEDAQAEAPQLRFRILDDIVSLVEQLASRAPFVLALEDLHWADSSALLVVDRLGRRLHQLRLALIGTRRPLPNRPELDSLMASAGHEGFRVPLPPLADPAVDALVNQLLGAPPGAQLLATVADAAGNPFFLEELVEALRIEGAIELVDGRAELEDVLLPPSLRLTILTRLAFLSKETLETLRVASVLGASFSPNDLAAVLGRGGIDLVRLLGEAIEGGVLSEEGERLVFRHDLVRDAIYEDLPVPLRQALHRDAGRALAAARAPARQVATQLARGASAGDAETIEWLMRGAHEVFPTAPAIAADFLQRAQELAGEDYEQREHIDAELVRALLWSGRLRDAERIAHAFLARRPDPELAATVRYALARVLVYQGSVGDSIEQVEAALADPTLGDQLRARLLGDLALRRAVVLDLDQADAAAGEAQALADGIVDDLASSTARSARAWSLTLRGHYTEAVEVATSALAYADRRPLEPVQVVQARLYLGRILLDVDDLEQAGRTLEDARRLAEELGAAYGVPLA
jgi:predicted ATPase